MTVHFYDSVDDKLLKFAVIVARYQGQYVFCKHKERETLEVSGGHREPNEDIEATAKRELNEETGAIDFELIPVCVYSVIDPQNFDGQETFGMLYFAEIKSLESTLHYEIEKIVLSDTLPTNWTYPTIQPILMQKVFEMIRTE